MLGLTPFRVGWFSEGVNQLIRKPRAPEYMDEKPLDKQPGVPYGKDSAAINIQRGRDHGLLPYVEIVKLCSEGTVLTSSFDDLYKLGLMSKENADLLKRIYAAVEDIDMWVGIQLEDHMSGAITGPSASTPNNCISTRKMTDFISIWKGRKLPSLQ
ncbi:hypothetical protein AVEN_174179-1, partial [Araneus ventricosus]